MSKKLVLNLATNSSEEKNLTTDEQKIFDNKTKAFNDAAPSRALNILREKRNLFLMETDHFALSDQTLTDNMKTYRQALRDLPSDSDWPNPTFPEKPEE